MAADAGHSAPARRAPLTGFFLIGLDTAAAELENPFGKDFNDLPLDMITDTIRSNLMDIKKRALAMRSKPVMQEV